MLFVICYCFCNTIADDQWNQICKEFNGSGTTVYKSFQYDWYDVVGMIISIVITMGVGLLFIPLWQYRFFKKSVENVRIGRLKCRLECKFSDYFWRVYVYSLLLNIFTVGMYTLTGFSSIHQAYFFDTHVKWYTVSSEDEPQP